MLGVESEMPLTVAAINHARPREKVYKLADGGGLYLEVHPTGARYWRLKYRHANKERRLAIGVYPDVTLAEARTARDSARKLIKSGNDPVAVKREVRRKTECEAANTFEIIAREWVEHQRARWTPDHASTVLRTLEANVFPTLGAKPITNITAPELLAAIRSVERRDALEVASRVAQRCGAVFRFAIATGPTTPLQTFVAH